MTSTYLRFTGRPKFRSKCKFLIKLISTNIALLTKLTNVLFKLNRLLKATKVLKSTKAPSLKSTKAPSIKSFRSTKAPSLKSFKARRLLLANDDLDAGESHYAGGIEHRKLKARKFQNFFTSTKAPSLRSTKAPSLKAFKSTKAPSLKSTKAPSLKSFKAR